MAPCSSPHTIELERFKGQFFQWYYATGFSMGKVKESFDTLFDYLRTHEGKEYHAT